MALETDKKETMDSAITSALETHKDGAPNTEETPVVTKTTDDTTKKPDAKPKFQGLDDVALENAAMLYASLNDPDKAPAVLEFIAKQGGYEKITTKKEVTEAKKTVQSILRTALGDDLEPLADKLAPALEELFKEKLAESTKDIRETIKGQEAKALENLLNDTTTSLAKKYFKKDELPDDIVVEMNKFMERTTPGKDMSMGEYVETAFYAVMGKRGNKFDMATVTDKVNKNRTDATIRLASEGNNRQPAAGAVTEVTKKMSLDESIRAAIEAERAKLEQ